MFKGAEALGLMQSRAGVTPESLVDLKEALALVLSEGANADPLPGDEQVTDRLRYLSAICFVFATHITFMHSLPVALVLKKLKAKERRLCCKRFKFYFFDTNRVYAVGACGVTFTYV